MGLYWADYLSVGNEMIDSDHKNLITVINRVEGAILARDRAEVCKAFELLDTFMGIHSKNEEKIAEAVNFPFAKNKLEHRQLMFEMKYMIKELESTFHIWPDELVQTYTRFLNRWVTDHIIKTDMQMKPALLAFPYDFKPG